MNMVEKVARAIKRAQTRSDAELAMDGPWREFELMSARAAIEAMREPTEKMIAEGNAHDERAPYDIYESMIDAALSE